MDVTKTAVETEETDGSVIVETAVGTEETDGSVIIETAVDVIKTAIGTEETDGREAVDVIIETAVGTVGKSGTDGTAVPVASKNVRESMMRRCEIDKKTTEMLVYISFYIPSDER